MRNKLALCLIALSLGAALLLSGCSAGPSAPSDGYTSPESDSGASSSSGSWESDSTAVVSGSDQALGERKVIRNAHYEISCVEYETALARVNEEIERLLGYVQSAESVGSPSKGNASTRYVLRIPAGKLNEFRSFIPGLGEIRFQKESGEDVTGQYFDTESQLKVLRAQEERILSFMEQATNLDEIFQIENELTNIRVQIERLTTVRKQIDDLSSFATVELELVQSQADETIEPEQRPGFGSRFGETFLQSFRIFGEVADRAVLILIWMLPYFLLAGLVAFACVSLSRASRRRKAKKALPPPDENEDENEGK
ncbi:MAG: DUF4349 domain-containing protein [Christensenellaceae bacterium]|jgi:hypothetical protein|nr:DUF4349 domain-containing protein [Christensenellaceae bacterium]